MKLTFGVELEFGNCLYGTPLPDGACWNSKDNTCVSSTGIANDPKGQLYRYGGEINTTPTKTVSEQVAQIGRIIEVVKPIVNYRSNMHIHIGVPGLENNLKLLKAMFEAFQNQASDIFNLVEPIPKPTSRVPEVVKWENLRYKRRLVSHHYLLPQARVNEVMAAKTPKEFFEAHAPLVKGKRMWIVSPRPAFNFRQLWETGTIEFRHFPGTLDLREIRRCIEWCEHAVTNYARLFPNKFMSHEFPTFPDYEYYTEQGYQFTNLALHSRREVAKRLALLRLQLNIDDLKTKSKQTYEAIVYLRGKYQSFTSS